MAGWILTLLLVAGVFGGVAYQRRRRYPRFLFNAWAVAIYALAILGAALLGAGGNALLGDDPAGLLALAVVAGLAALAATLLTLFFRWVLNNDIHDIPD
jgi:hypothetical protein